MLFSQSNLFICIDWQISYYVSHGEKKFFQPTALGHPRRCGLRRCYDNPGYHVAARCDVSSVHSSAAYWMIFRPLVPTMTGIIDVNGTKEFISHNGEFRAILLH